MISKGKMPLDAVNRSEMGVVKELKRNKHSDYSRRDITILSKKFPKPIDIIFDW